MTQYIFVEEVNVNFQHLLLLLLWQQSSVEGGVHWELSTNLLGEEEEVDFREHGTARFARVSASTAADDYVHDH